MLNEHQGIEGFVIKSYGSKFKHGLLAVKEKHDTLKIDKIPKDIKEGNPKLPPLPDSEIYGAIDKVLSDIGIDSFKNIKVAMPLIARAISDEANKHYMSQPRNVFFYYSQKLEDLK